jgi:hypothetical protein
LGRESSFDIDELMGAGFRHARVELAMQRVAFLVVKVVATARKNFDEDFAPKRRRRPFIESMPRSYLSESETCS